MKPAFALDFRDDSISLLHRSGSGWQAVGAVALDTPDLPDALGYLRATALGLSPRALATKLIIPNDQILYTTVTAPGPDEASRLAQIRAGLEGRTPYDVADLVFDWSGDGPDLQVAVIARETLAEAEGFAAEHRFNPVSFVAVPEGPEFAGEPWFGPSALAATLVAAGDAVERDGVPVLAVSRGFMGEPAAVPDPVEPEPMVEVPPQPEAVPEIMPENEPEPDMPAPEVEPSPAPEALPDYPEEAPPDELPKAVPAELPEAEPWQDPAPAEKPDFDVPEDRVAVDPVADAAAEPAQPASDAADDDRDLIAALADTLSEPIIQPEPPAPAPRPVVVMPEVEEAPMALDVPHDETPLAPEPQGADVIKAAIKAQRARVIAPAIEDDLPPAPSAAALGAFSSRRQGDEPEVGKAPVLGSAKSLPPRPAGGKQLPPNLPRPNGAKPPVPTAAKPAKAAKSGLRGLGSLVTAPGIAGVKARSKVDIPSALPPARATDASQPVRPAAAKPAGGFVARPPVRGKPRYLGLILTAVLLFLLAMIAAWSSYTLGAWNSTPEPVQTVAADPEPEIVVADAPDATDEMLADMQDPAAMTEGDVAAVDPGAEAITPPSEADVADLDPATAPATATEPAPATEVASDMAAPANPTANTQDEIYLATMDAPPVAPDPLALPLPEARGDPLPAAQPAPPPFGTVYKFSETGVIQPTPEGIITPEGVLLRAGKPSRVPTSRPETVIAAAAAANPVAAVDPAATEAAAVVADPALAGKKPKARPDGLAPAAPEDQGSLAPASDSRFASLRPMQRPASILSAGNQARLASAAASLTAQAEADTQEASLVVSKSAIEISRRPAARPRDLSRAVEAAVAAAVRQPDPEPTPAPAAEPEPAAAPEKGNTAEADGEPEVASAAPKIPTKATVAKQATFKNAINLSKINLIGVYGTQSNRYALVRLASGRYKKVKVGDNLDGGGRVAAITASELRYQKGSRMLSLSMPDS